MSRPKSNEKIMSFLEEKLEDIRCLLSDAVDAEEYSDAAILKQWKDSLFDALQIIKDNQRKGVIIEKGTQDDEKLPG
jgi:heme oxygenase